jgi:hypothetical protein
MVKPAGGRLARDRADLSGCSTLAMPGDQASPPFSTAPDHLHPRPGSQNRITSWFSYYSQPHGSSRCQSGNLNVLHTIFVSKERTADFQTTTGLRRIIENQGNKGDLLAFIAERRLPVDEIEASAIVDGILANLPEIGYLTLSNALQWRLQYGRVIEKAGLILGVERLR